MDSKRKSTLKELKERHKNLLSSELYNLLPDQTEYKQLLVKIQELKERITELNRTVKATSQQLHISKKKVKTCYNGLVRYLREALKGGIDYRQQGLCWLINNMQ